jgi:hypothetical protein
VSQLRHIRARLGTGTGRAKLPEVQVAIAPLGYLPTYPVAGWGEAKIVASPPRAFPSKRQAVV